MSFDPKPTRWARIKLFFCGMPDGTILHGEKIVSIPDLVNLEKNTSTLKKVILKKLPRAIVI